MAINYFSKKCCIPRYDRGADGGINPASVCSSGVRCSAPGRLGFVHLHALTACVRQVRDFNGD
ncbi:hypothetical protein R84B8_02874 [Treponema sp. R8-4-B8]